MVTKMGNRMRVVLLICLGLYGMRMRRSFLVVIRRMQMCIRDRHSMEHAMSAYHHNLPHGAGLIMISQAFAEFFIERHACDGQFIKMALSLIHI